MLQLRLGPDVSDLGLPPAPHPPSHRVWRLQYSIVGIKYPIKVGAVSTEGHCIKAMMSISMVAVLQRRISPDEIRFGVDASTTSTLLIVVGARNIEL